MHVSVDKNVTLIIARVPNAIQISTIFAQTNMTKITMKHVKKRYFATLVITYHVWRSH